MHPFEGARDSLHGRQTETTLPRLFRELESRVSRCHHTRSPSDRPSPKWFDLGLGAERGDVVQRTSGTWASNQGEIRTLWIAIRNRLIHTDRQWPTKSGLRCLSSLSNNRYGNSDLIANRHIDVDLAICGSDGNDERVANALIVSLVAGILFPPAPNGIDAYG